MDENALAPGGNMFRFIRIDIHGEIIEMMESLSIKENDDQTVSVRLSDKAYSFIVSDNIHKLNDTDELRYCPPGIIRHISEEEAKDDGSAFYPDDIIGFRINYMARGWDRINKMMDLESLSYSEIDYMLASVRDPQMNSSKGDAAVLTWMKNTVPRWEVLSFTSDAAALIANAKIETEEEPYFPDICLKSSDGYLFDTVTEILLFNDNSIPMIAITHTIARKMHLYIHAKIEDALHREDMPKSLKDAVHFVWKYLAIRECEKSPIETAAIQTAKQKRLARNGIRKVGGVLKYQVSLSKRYAATRKEKHEAMDKEGKVLTTVKVSGFVRNQAYGEGRALRKKIWVDGFTRGQWVRSGVTYVTVRE